MKLRAKILLFSSLFLIAMVASIATLVSYKVHQNAKRDVALHHEHEMERVRAEIKDVVDMAYKLIETEYNAMHDGEIIEEKYGERMKNVIESVQSLLAGYQRRVDAGEMTLADAQRQAKNEIRHIRYDDGKGYIWINDNKLPFPTMVMHPMQPVLEGTILSNKKWNTARGITRNIFAAAVRLTEHDGEGIIRYTWAEGNSADKPAKTKMSYVAQFKPWGWVLGGSGSYVEDIQSDVIEDLKKTIGELRYANGEGYFYIITDELPYPTNILQPLFPEYNGKVMNDPKWDNLAFNNTEHLFTALVKATRNVDGAGYVDYTLKQPSAHSLNDGGAPKSAKISYERSFKPLNWVIGSGLYTDRIDERTAVRTIEVKEEANSLIYTILFVSSVVLLLSILIAFFFARGLSKGLEELTAVAEEISLGKGLDVKIESTTRKDEIGQLALAIERLQTSVKMMMTRMQKKS